MNQRRCCAYDSGSSPVRQRHRSAAAFRFRPAPAAPRTDRRWSDARTARAAAAPVRGARARGSPAASPAASGRPARRSCPRSRRAPLPARPARSRTTAAPAPCAARRTASPCANVRLRLRQRAAVHLAVRRQRQRLQRHERRRHHVLRQPPAHVLAQLRGRRRSRRRRPRAASSRTASTTTSRTSACARSAASISPSSMRKPAHLDLVIAAAEELEPPVRAPAHQVAGAVQPRIRGSPENGSGMNRSAVRSGRCR